MTSLKRNKFIAPIVDYAPLVGTLLAYPFLILVSLLYLLANAFKVKTSDESIRGEVAVITGSARGLGRGIATELAKRGCHIAVVDIQRDLAEETAAHLAEVYGVKAKAYIIDVTNYQQLENLHVKVSSDLGDPTILVNNAAILVFSTPQYPPPEEISRMINTTQIFLPKMKELNRGHIVNISSLSALTAAPNFGIYASTKAAVRLLTSMVRMEMMYAKLNITATTVMPTFMNTNANVEEILNLAGPLVQLCVHDGEKTVQRIVEGMLKGDDEVVIPAAWHYIYKLYEILPTYVREKIFAILSKGSYQSYMRSSRIGKILKKEIHQHESTAREHKTEGK